MQKYVELMLIGDLVNNIVVGADFYYLTEGESASFKWLLDTLFEIGMVGSYSVKECSQHDFEKNRMFDFHEYLDRLRL